MKPTKSTALVACAGLGLMAACLDPSTDADAIGAPAATATDGQHEETAVAGGHDGVRRAMVRMRGEYVEMDVTVKDGLAFVEGDILVGRVEDLIAPGTDLGKVARSNIETDVDDIWPSHVIPYELDDTLDSQGRMNVLAAIKVWEDATVFDFVERTDQTDYIEFVGDGSGCYSWIGYVGYGQNVNLENGKCGQGNAIHEIGHALGLYHEQARSDRDSYLAYFSSNVEWGQGSQFSIDGTKHGAFDWGSIMLYGSLSFTSNGRPTLLRKDGWGWRKSTVDSAGKDILNPWATFRGGETSMVQQAQFGDFDGDGKTDALKLVGNDWMIASPATSGTWALWSTLPSSSTGPVFVGQFDTDPRADLFRADGVKWYVSYAGKSAWTVINTQPYYTGIYLGDFNADGRTDVMRPNGATWDVSWFGSTGLQKLNTSGYTNGKLAVGQFDGVGGTDVLITTGAKWLLSSGGSQPATEINTSGYVAQDLIVGDFDGNGRADVARHADLQRYEWSKDAVGGWTELTDSAAPLNTYVRVVDLDDDGRDDLLGTGFFTGQRNGLSRGDVTAIHELYFGSWQISVGGNKPFSWRGMTNTPVTDLKVGDFNHDGKDDVFKADGSKWWYASGAQGDWIYLNSSGYGLADVALGDFDGDGYTDVFRADGSKWWISRRGTGTWTQWNSSGYALDKLKIGDLNGDGRADVFLATGTEWYVSYGGNSGWTKLVNSGVTAVTLADLNGDGKDDVFYPNGTTWDVSYNGTPGWHTINTSGYRLDAIRLGDFNGDGRADVVRTDGSNWYISYAGISPWLVLNISGYTLPKMLFGDFTGDGKTDILVHFGRLAK